MGASRAEKLVVAACAAGLLASLVVLVHPWYDPVRDASVYIATARSLAAGEGYQYLGVPLMTRPPGFAAMLVPLLSVFGTSFHVLNLFVALFGCVGVGLLYLLVRPRLGWGLALLVCAAVWLNPGYQRLCNQVLSDVPGTTLLLACLLLERWSSRSPSWRRDLLLGLAIGLASTVRSIDVLLLPAIVVARLVSRFVPGAPSPAASAPPGAVRRLAVLAAATALVLLPWSVRNRRVAPEPPVDQVTIYDYSTGMWHRDHGDPRSPRVPFSEVLGRVPRRVKQIGAALGGRLITPMKGDEAPEEPLAPLHAALAALLVAGLLWGALRHGEPAELFALGTLGVCCVYFGFNTRLVLPVYVLALPATAELVRDGIRRVAGRRGAPARDERDARDFGDAGTLGAAAAVAALLAADFHPRLDWGRIEAEHEKLVRRAAAVAAALEPDARLGAWQGFHYGVYLERPVYSLEIAVRRAGTLDVVEQTIDEHGIDTLVLAPSEPFERQLLRVARERYPTVRAGSAFVVRVRP